MSQHARNNPDDPPLFDVVPADIRRRQKHYGSTFTTRTAENEAIETPTLPAFKPTEDGGPKLECWNLRKPIPGHPAGSTVTRGVLRKHFLPRATP